MSSTLPGPGIIIKPTCRLGNLHGIKSIHFDRGQDFVDADCVEALQSIASGAINAGRVDAGRIIVGPML